MTATPVAQFWLMTGVVPSGPFTIEQVHAEVAAGRATWQTLACPVGTADATWRPLVQTAGVGPVTTANISGEPSFPGHPNPQPAATREPEPPTLGRRSRPVPRWLGAVGAVVALIPAVAFFGGKLIQSRNAGKPPVTWPTGGIQKLLSGPTAVGGPTQPTATTGTYSGWNLGGPPVIPASLQDQKTLLVGSWRWDGGGGYATTFAFEASGTFTYYVTGANAVLNVPVARCEASGRWSVRDGTLFVEFTGASEAALVPVFRGRTAKAPVKFADTDRLQLAGIEGDAIARTYTRVR